MPMRGGFQTLIEDGFQGSAEDWKRNGPVGWRRVSLASLELSPVNVRVLSGRG